MAISKSDVRRFVPGTAEYVVTHAKWRKRRGRKPSTTFSQHKNPTRALKWARHYAYFPVSGEYLEGEVPEHYVCGECGEKNVKLWREYQTSLDQQSLLCMTCACRQQGEIRTPTEDGRSLYTDKVHYLYRTATMQYGSWHGYDPKEGPPSEAIETLTRRERTDQIGWRVPAIPTEENNSYWGYTSVPGPGIDWWSHLPTSPSNKTN